jgi:MFS family permease
MNMPDFSHRLSVSGQLTLSVFWFSLNFLSGALFAIVIPTQILLFVSPGAVGNAQQAAFLGWLTAGGSVLALLVPPIIGILSDHTTGSWGRRRPYIVAGTLFMLVGLFMLSSAHEPALFILGFLIYQAASNGGTAAYQSLLPDLVPADQRGEASGYMGLMTMLGTVGSLALAAWLLSQVNPGPSAPTLIRQGASIYYTVTGLALVIGALITVIGVHETPLSFESSPAASTLRTSDRLRNWITRNWVEPWRGENFAWVFLTRAFVMLGLTLFMTFIEYYFASVEHITNFVQATAIVAVLALLGAVASALGLGVLSDRIGRIWIVCFATLCMALASLSFVLFPDRVPLWPLGILFGLGYGAYTSVDWALAVDSLPSLSAAGKDLGLWSIASTAPSILAPLLGSIVIELTAGQLTLGYRLVFALAVFFFLLGAAFVFRIREQPGTRTPSAHPRTRRRIVSLGWRLAFRSHAGQARGFLLFWPFWEWLTISLQPIKSIPHAPYGLLGVTFKRYHGRPVDLPDGVHVERGALIGELHFHNRKIVEASQAGPWKLVRMFMLDMRALARWTQEPDFPAAIQAFHGVTLVGRAARRLGFITYERPKTLHNRLDRFFMMGLLVLYHHQGLERLRHGTTYGTYPQDVWMSRRALMKRYGDLIHPDP